MGACKSLPCFQDKMSRNSWLHGRYHKSFRTSKIDHPVSLSYLNQDANSKDSLSVPDWVIIPSPGMIGWGILIGNSTNTA